MGLPTSEKGEKRHLIITQSLILFGRMFLLYSYFNFSIAARQDAFKLTLDPKQRVCLRMMQIFSTHCSITYLGTCEDLIVAGTSESKVCFFDAKFVLHW